MNIDYKMPNVNYIIILIKLLIISISDWSEAVYFFDLRTYRLQVMPYKEFKEFIAVEAIDIRNYVDIRDRLFDGVDNYNDINIMRREFENMFDERLKLVIENVCQKAAQKFTDNFIDEMMAIRELEDY